MNVSPRFGRRVVLLVAGAMASPLAAVAQSPAPGIMDQVDTRTTDAPTVVGGPLEVLLGVILLGAVTALLTASWVRLVSWRSRS